MDTNVVVDDEFQSGQANALVGQLRKIKCQLGVTHVHHDFGRNVGHGPALDFRDFCFQQAVINSAGIALCTADCDQGAIFELIGCVATTHHGRNTQFARNDGGVARPAASVGDNGTGALHHGLPIGIGHVSDQHVTCLDLVHLRDAVDQTNRPSPNFLTNGAALGQHSALAFQGVAQFCCAFGLALDGLWASLQDIKQAVCAILAPLNVHGPAVVLLDDHGVLRQLGDVFVCQGIAVAQLHGHIDGFDKLA